MKTPILTVLKLRGVEIGFLHELAKDEILNKVFSVHGYDTQTILIKNMMKMQDICMGIYD